MSTVEININTTCELRWDKSVLAFVSYCPAFNIYSQAETEADAIEAIRSAVTLCLQTAYDFNALNRLLTKAGFAIVDQLQPVEVKQKQIPITIVLRLQAASDQRSASHPEATPATDLHL